MDTSGPFPIMEEGDPVASVPSYTKNLSDDLIAMGVRPSCYGITPPVTVNVNSWTTQNIVFPPGLFTAPPLVFVTPSTGQIIPGANFASMTKSGGQISGDNRATIVQNNVRLAWYAVQP